MSGRRPTLLLSALAVASVLLGGCGEETSTGEDPRTSGSSSAAASPTPSAPTTDTASSTASDLPACEEVWVAGAVLPRGYRGCFDGTAEVLPRPLRCSTGQKIVTHDPYWAVPGAQVQETEGLAGDRNFADVKSQCQA